MYSQQYIQQVNLLLNCLPALNSQTDFALKGGTAINFFIHDLPRLSVDIDLTYVPLEDRPTSLDNIEKGLLLLQHRIEGRNKHYRLHSLYTKDNRIKKLIVSFGSTKIKIEPNFIMRGTVLPIQMAKISKSINQEFNFNVENIPTLAKEELYAGKLCAALSRQHPRDLFDVNILFREEGISTLMRRVFVVYLLCAPKPIYEMLNPTMHRLDQVYQNEFKFMTKDEITLDELENTRSKLIEHINHQLDDNDKAFILSVKKATPDYSLLPFDNLHKLPALNWKIENIRNMNKQKHHRLLNRLDTHLMSL